MYDLEFTASAASFLRQVGGYLIEHPVVENVVATVADRAVRDDAEGVVRPSRPWWFAAVRTGGEVVGVAMRTAPGPEYAIWVGRLPKDAAVQLAEAVVGRGETVRMVTGCQDPARTFAEQVAMSRSKLVRVGERTRLFELAELEAPVGVSGSLRPTTEDDLDVVHGWREVFLAAAEEQAGRPVMSRPAMDVEDTRRRIRDHRLWVWEDGGQPVHLTGASPPSAGVARIAPVYTPKPFRGHGYAMAAVSAVSQLFLDHGARVCLFTDLANPVSNKIYQRIGYRPVVDMAQLIIE